jgi:excisionase family DNA binding protein
VTSYRRMRRQARQVRRTGMQPMMVINSGDQPPETAGVLLLRWAWRYRSELAPLYLAAAIFGAYWLHTTRPQWWAFVLGLTIATAAALTWFGARIGLSRFLERLYVSVTVLAAGTWLTAATSAGPLTSPLPKVLGIAGVLVAVPWWTSRRRRAKVRVDRKLESWPDIARAIGLAGSQVMSATVDIWGWRARFRLARGQTIADMTARIPAIESGLGTFRGSVRVYPTADDLANRCELRVLDLDPHADAIPWPGPSVTTITEPIDLGPFEDAAPCRVLFLRRHGLAARALGLGRSTAYELARRNELPCRVLHVGSSYRIPTADLLRVLGIEPPTWEHRPTLPPAA